MHYLKLGFNGDYDMWSTKWFPYTFQIKDKVVVNKNLMVICFERQSCWNQNTNIHDYLKITDGIRISLTDQLKYHIL